MRKIKLFSLSVVSIVVAIVLIRFVNGDLFPLTPQPANQLSQNFLVREQILTLRLTTHMVLRDGQNDYGSIDESLLSLGKTFTWTDGNGHTVATAHQRFINIGVHIDVTDDAGNQIGAIEEDVLGSLLLHNITTHYRILDTHGRQIAESTKFDVFATTFTLTDSSGRVFATLDRPFLHWPTDVWTVQLNDAPVDKRLIVFIAAYKTSADNADESSH